MVCEVCGAPDPDADEASESSEEDDADDNDGTNDSADNADSDKKAAEANVVSGEAAPTGDNTSFAWIYLLGASSVMLGLCLLRRKRR